MSRFLLMLFLAAMVFFSKIEGNVETDSTEIIQFFDHLSTQVKSIEDAKLALEETVCFLKSNFNLEIDLERGYVCALRIIQNLEIPKDYIHKTIQNLDFRLRQSSAIRRS